MDETIGPPRPVAEVQLPLELWDAILSYFSRDARSLSSFSLACRNHRVMAMPYLFSKLAVGCRSHVRHAEDFFSFLTLSPPVASHIVDLTLNNISKRPQPVLNPDTTVWPRGVPIDLLAQILHSLPSLQKLTLRCDLLAKDHSLPRTSRLSSADILQATEKLSLAELTLDSYMIEESACIFSPVIRILSLFSSIDHLIVRSLPEALPCTCLPDTTKVLVDNRIWQTDQQFDDVFGLPGHCPPALSIRSIDFGTGSRITSRRALTKILTRCALSSAQPPASCSLSLWCGNVVMPEVCSELVEAYGPRLADCNLYLETAICGWSFANAPLPPSPARQHRLDLSSCTSLTSLSLTGVWNLRSATTVAKGGPNATFAILDVLSTVPPSIIQHLSIALTIYSFLAAPTTLTLREVVRPLIDWRSFRLILQEKFAALQSLKFKWTIPVEAEFGDEVTKWMRRTVDEELKEWVKAGLLQSEIATR
ncbi:hypothetical protein EIP91_003930 [Steccherinum ochraceum]|uniref:F-box domain-containing protein n=1 Tax=Steccherinum ochraceum TaxID=92696 RepID=A0A4R0RNQ0_9APHY|nr:hypothetical protein EIP91_003930 [Steccherinum ochraceum]